MSNFLTQAKKVVFFGFFAVGVIAVLAVLFNLGGQVTKTVSRPGGLSGMAPSVTPMAGSYGTAESGAGNPLADLFTGQKRNESASDSAAKTPSETDRKVIRRGDLTLAVGGAEAAVARIREIAQSAGGFVEDSHINGTDSETQSGYIAVRIPAPEFSRVMAEIKTVGLKTQYESESAQDVSEQYVDLESQLRNLKATEEQYLAIMQRATRVEETMQVAQQLTSVRGQIERLQGQMQYLARQVDMSAIYVNLIADADVQIFGVRWRPVYEAKKALRGMLEGFMSFANAVIAFVFVLPVLALWLAALGLLGFLGYAFFRWFRRRFFPAG